MQKIPRYHGLIFSVLDLKTFIAVRLIAIEIKYLILKGFRTILSEKFFELNEALKGSRTASISIKVESL